MYYRNSPQNIPGGRNIWTVPKQISSQCPPSPHLSLCAHELRVHTLLLNYQVEEIEGRASSDEDSSSDDDKEWLEEMREQRKKIKQERRVKELRRQMDEMTKMYEVDQGEEKKDDHKKTNKLARYV